MDILIKGMEIKGYPQSITINPDGSVIKDTFGLHRPVEEWKAIELPPHGRCIDVDTVIRQLRKWGDAPIKRDNIEIANLLESLAETNTVLEANE